MITKYEQIVDVTKIGRRYPLDLNPIFALAKQEHFPTSAYDSDVLFLGIDFQNDFTEFDGTMAVSGSIGDIERTTRFIYRNMGKISCIMCSTDKHIPQQIFHPCWWVNPAGDHPAPYTIITYDDVMANRWYPAIGDPEISIQYLRELEKINSGENKLCIWPYHCIFGTDGASLENEFAKMVYFHSIVRNTINPIIQKGTDQYSEMYGIIRPEYSRENYINMQVLDAVKKYDKVLIAGEAASHCFLKSVVQIAEYFADQPEITEKITILEDCTSPIKGFESYTIEAFKDLENLYGIKVEKSTNIQL